AGAIIRSAITTSLDSFTFDEAYHVGAGASYIQTGDLRLNPEQPPLTKLWVGSYVTMLGYAMSPFRSYADKNDERKAVEEDAYFKNDPEVLQQRTRTAMFGLNALLIFIFALAVRRVFGDVMSIGATTFLAIDPTVAAHLPVMMTDLPVGLTSGAAVLFAVNAFRNWKLVDIVAASATLGLALAAKHSAVITAAVVALIGIALAMVFARSVIWPVRLKRLGVVAGVLVGSLVILWSFYFFRFRESPATAEETFNRPLATKISDVKSPVYRAALNLAANTYLLPRAYIWGLADTIRAGAEGRAIPILAFGEMYYSKGPVYYFPGVIAAKLPVGLLLLSLFGAGLLLTVRLPASFIAPVAGLAALAAMFLVFLIMGSSYGGVRHALPIYPLLAVLGAVPIYFAIRKRSYILGVTLAVPLLVAIIASVPVMRPWEYFNEFAGGPENAHLYFSDEGIDLGMRLKEISAYYDQNLRPNGEIPFLVYFCSDVERRRRELDWIGKDQERDAPRLNSDTLEGTFIIGGPELSPKLWWDVAKPLREAEPIARFGNVFVFRGKFPRLPSAPARTFYFRAIYTKLYVPEPDINSGIELLAKSTELDPAAFHVALELGNQYLKLGNRQEALRAYQRSLDHAPQTDNIRDVLIEQVERLKLGAEDIQPIRNPGVE
ncbi:MAG TPA: hypothetical protein VFZ23_02610, partial [Pyrinomonadaceae bacterium]